MTGDDERQRVCRHHPADGAGCPRASDALGEPAVRPRLAARDALRFFEHGAAKRRPNIPIDVDRQVVVAARRKGADSLRQVRQVRITSRYGRAQLHDLQQRLISGIARQCRRPKAVRREDQAHPAEIGLAQVES